MDGVQKVITLIAILIFLLILSIVSLSFWQSNQEMLSRERLLKAGFSPAIFTCTENRAMWSNLSTYNICHEILLKNHLTREEAEQLIKGLNK